MPSSHGDVQCPFCHAQSSDVVDSRGLAPIRKRIRVCKFCGRKFETIEHAPVNPFLLDKFRKRKSTSV